MKCPKCGSEMVLRIARQGKHAGNKFYGCSNYPKCKHVVDYKDSTFPNEEANAPINEEPKTIISGGQEFNDIELPVRLIAREKFHNYQANFYETIGLPYDLLELYTSGIIHEEKLKFFNQWRLDFPASSKTINDPCLRKIFFVAYKILTRGSFTLVSPILEIKFKEIFGITDLNSNRDFTFFYRNINSSPNTNIWFDGIRAEKEFYEDFLFKNLGKDYWKYVLPQVQFSSLLNIEEGHAYNHQRVDFLITLPEEKIIVEIDGEEHSGHFTRDENRDQLLRNNGYQVIRVRNDEIFKGEGNITKLKEIFTNVSVNDDIPLSNEEYYLFALKVAHQIEIAIVEAFLNGFLDIAGTEKIYLDDKSIFLYEENLTKILNIIKSDLEILFNNLAQLYKFNSEIKLSDLLLLKDNKEKLSNDLIFTYNSGFIPEQSVFYIQDITFPGKIAQHSLPIDYGEILDIDPQILRYFLRYIFRHQDFLEGQVEAITRALGGNDTIVLLPTGAGKSVAFQLASLLLPGIAVVINPTISLIDDQVDNLRRVGIDRAIGITSQITDPGLKSKVIKTFGQGEYLFCYVSPERFQTEEFRKSLKALTVSIPICLIVIDEAHCVSEWGHDFRTAYLNIGRISREYCKFNEHIPGLMALTGTASSSVLRDVQRELQIENFDAIITPRTFDRAELHYSVFSGESNKKYSILGSILQNILPNSFGTNFSRFYQLQGKTTNCGLLFCPHVDGSHGVVENSDEITRQFGIFTKYYGGKKPARWNNTLEWNKYKKQTAKGFKDNSFPLLVATKSFGMGIDKPNIRYTIHYGLPGSIESFYQEAGRAGRDRVKAECTMILSNDFPERTNRILHPESTIEEISEILKNERGRKDDDDITRAIWFHVKSFKGVEKELEVIEIIIEEISDFQRSRTENILFPDLERETVEKGLHRLLILGAISDYTINYSSEEFNVRIASVDNMTILDNYSRYVSGYNRGRVINERQKLIDHINEPLNDFILSASKILVEFIYDTIEKGRKRGLREMLSLAEDALKGDSNTIIRNRILRYLETTYSEEIEQIIEETDSFEGLIKLMDGYIETESGESIGGVRSPKDATEVRGQVARYLESYPDHPGLLFLRALSELYTRDYDSEIIKQNLFAGYEFALSRYNISQFVLNRLFSWIAGKFFDRKPSIYLEIFTYILYELNNEDLARLILTDELNKDEMLILPGIYLFGKHSEKGVKLFI